MVGPSVLLHIRGLLDVIKLRILRVLEATLSKLKFREGERFASQRGDQDSLGLLVSSLLFFLLLRRVV